MNQTVFTVTVKSLKCQDLMLLSSTSLGTNTPECYAIIVILTELLFLPPKDSESTSASICARQPPYCNHRFYSVPRNCQRLDTLSFPGFLRVFITLLEAETTSLLNACLLLPQMAGKKKPEEKWRFNLLHVRALMIT